MRPCTATTRPETRGTRGSTPVTAATRATPATPGTARTPGSTTVSTSRRRRPAYGQQQPLYPEPSPPSLAEAVRAFTTGAMTPEDFQAVFATSKVYCPRGDTPGFLALHNTQQPVIPMFTTLKELRAYAGKESKYFVITGAEVLDLLPSGYGFVLDMEGDHRIVFDAKAVEEMVDFAMRRMYG
ncbi:SseB family protein [Streptomyces radiopugnans]|nr:SseB family protein [Streptomyces radiopugnans]